MDPQQRLLLETAWEALERAGIDPTVAARQRHRRVRRRDVPGLRAVAAATGADELRGLPDDRHRRPASRPAASPTRLGLKGPAVTRRHGLLISLVALHLAAQALRAGECSLALAGGVTVMASPASSSSSAGSAGCRRTAAASRSRRPPTARAGPRASGVLVLERLSDARRHGHAVLAVIRGSAVNQDGACNGLTAPNGPSQQRVIRQALAERGPDAGRRRRRRGARHRHDAGRPDRGAGAAGRPTAGPRATAAVARLGQVEHRPHPGRGRCGRRDQDGAWRCGTGCCRATLHVDAPTPHVDWSDGRGAAADRGGAVAAPRSGRGGRGCPRSASAARTRT